MAYGGLMGYIYMYIYINISLLYGWQNNICYTMDIWVIWFMGDINELVNWFKHPSAHQSALEPSTTVSIKAKKTIIWKSRYVLIWFWYVHCPVTWSQEVEKHQHKNYSLRGTWNNHWPIHASTGDKFHACESQSVYCIIVIFPAWRWQSKHAMPAGLWPWIRVHWSIQCLLCNQRLGMASKKKTDYWNNIFEYV